MHIFITGTDTDIGKTVISSWLCLQTNYSYFKPIQTGTEEGSDSQSVYALTGRMPYEEAYRFKAPLSPHLAASRQGQAIDPFSIALPDCPNLIIEGAGGLLVPLNRQACMIDLIDHMKAPVILVARSKLGTINHTLLSLNALRLRSISVLGVILNGSLNSESAESIEFYGKTTILAQVPEFKEITAQALLDLPLSAPLQALFDS